MPVKVKPSPASERPENRADEALAHSSREFQERMRKKAQLHTDNKQNTASKTTTKQKTTKEADIDPIKPAVAPVAVTEAERVTNTDVTQKHNMEETNAVQRLTIRVPFNLTAQNEVAKMAKSLGKNDEYVIKALLKNARADLLKFWKNEKFPELTSDAKLIVEQNNQSATVNYEIKPSVPEALIREARKLLDDPLGLRTDNQVIGAFISATILAKITKR